MNETKSPFATVEEAVEEIRQGRMIVLIDDEDRENEGDLAMAAEKITPEVINFMAKYGRGLICMPLTEDRCDELHLPLMSPINTSAHGTAFTESIDARVGVTTGISASDRAVTILTAIDPKTKPQDLARPGHIFPLRARHGGVLVRAGQTEASVCPARTSTPPWRARSGKMWPGRARSCGLVFGSMAVRMVTARSEALMPVVTPTRASMDSVKAVPWAEVLMGDMSGRCSSSQRSSVRGMQMRPRPYLAMKLMASGVIFSAAMVRSPSFSRSSSSTRTIMRPWRISSTASSTVAKGDLVSVMGKST